MSSVLKALKRLEHEKASRNGGPPRLDDEILRGTEPEAKGFSFIKRSIAAFILVAASSSATYFIISKTGTPVSEHQASPTPAKDNQNKPAATEHDNASNPPPVVTVQAESFKPARKPEVNANKTTPVEKNNNPSTPHLPEQSKPLMKTAEKKSAVKPDPAKAGSYSLQGIAHDESGESIAVINGNAVTAGGKVDGAVVEEIRKDRVRLNYNGEKVEVILQADENR